MVLVLAHLLYLYLIINDNWLWRVFAEWFVHHNELT